MLFFNSLRFIEIKKKLTMDNVVVIGLQELQTGFSTYKQFVGHLCNVFEISNDRRSLWNGTQMPVTSIGLHELRTLVGTYEQFTSRLCNVFLNLSCL